MDADLLLRAVARLSKASTGEFAVEVMLQELCAVAAEAFDVDGAGVMRVDGPNVRFVQARAGPDMTAVEHLQEVLQRGPCEEGVRSGQPVLVTDLRSDPRWPQYSAAAVELDVCAVLAVPLVSRGRSWGCLDLYRRAPGEWEPPEVDAGRLLADVAVSYIVMALDRDAARTARQLLTRRAMTDELTGLPNRGLMVDRMAHALAVGRRTGQVTAAVFIDLDRFKDINDTRGHAAGDIVLGEASRRMNTALREGDTLARFGGDEFVLLCEFPGGDDQQARAAVARICDQIREVLLRPIPLGDGTEVIVSASMGVALTGDGAATADDLLRSADTAMYEAKQQGRSRVVFSPWPDDTIPYSARQLERDLTTALDRGELTVHYQPILDAGQLTVRAVEALLRWDHPVYGQLPAAAFISLAAATGTLTRIGRWVIDQACSQMQRWQTDPDIDPPEIVFCNVSPRELTDPGLAATVKITLLRCHLNAGQLGLEIVEASFDDTLLIPVITAYHHSGHPLAIDDFGTGYSSLSRLIHLSVDYAKIDRSFVAGLPADPQSRALVDAVVAVAATLGLRVIAEGVETQAQADYLTAAGCQLLQGFHLAHPMSATHLTELLTSTAPPRPTASAVPGPPAAADLTERLGGESEGREPRGSIH